ncbi:SDR family oxidoreductase [Verticiella sediminum]|uniref:SDR family oxidoreductase n=1 Tax=Verticiella sediminum TaxID=1247510 RepID=A0A556A6J1_9BURK|nr:SDR family oxidoreductase [Verticiella sediminum]TSH88484.1 SDR family oxidoreductase [Verticiella sediminum]
MSESVLPSTAPVPSARGLGGAVAIVTGGAGGIGLAIAGHLAREGAHVVIADRSAAQASAAQLAGEGLSVSGIDVDVASERDVQAMVAHAEASHGRLDILVNNAGIYSSLTPKPFSELTAAEWRQVFDVNVIGLFLCCQRAAPAMRRAGGGRIVNISSGVAFKGNPLMAHYVASKGAVISLTRALATEMGQDNILVNSVAPGFTLSDGVLNNATLVDGVKGPSLKGRVLGRAMYPDDLVGAVAFFAGSGAGFITGQTLVVDGGAYYH